MCLASQSLKLSVPNKGFNQADREPAVVGIMIKVIYDMYEHSSFMIKPLS